MSRRLVAGAVLFGLWGLGALFAAALLRAHLGGARAGGEGPEGAERVARAVLVEESVGLVHTVSAGETLSSIAEGYFGARKAWRRIARANGMTHPYILSVGMELGVPEIRVVRTSLSMRLQRRGGPRQGLVLAHPLREAFAWSVPLWALLGYLGAAALAAAGCLLKAPPAALSGPAVRTVGTEALAAGGALLLYCTAFALWAADMVNSRPAEFVFSVGAAAVALGAALGLGRLLTGHEGGRAPGGDLARLAGRFAATLGLVLWAALVLLTVSGALGEALRAMRAPP